MKKILLASLLITGLFSVDVMAKKDGKGKGDKPSKPTFTDGCLVVDSNAKGPMANVSKADTDGDGCITEDEFKTYMKENKPEGKGREPKSDDAE